MNLGRGNNLIQKDVSQSRQNRSRGLTLVEVMLALSLGSAVVSAAGVVAVQSVQVERSLKSEMLSQWQREQVLRQFESDVRSALNSPGKTAPAFRFQENPGHLVTIASLAQIPERNAFSRRRMPSQVTYSLRWDPNDDRYQVLVRSVKDMTQPESQSIEQRLAEDLQEVSIEYFADKKWQAGPIVKSAGNPVIRALRLRCRWAGDDRAETIRTVPTRSNDGRNR